MSNCNVKSFKNQSFGNFRPLIEYGPHSINFTILIFISENNRYFKGLYKIWNKIISFDMTKKVKCKTSHRKNEESCEFRSPRSEFLCFKWGTPMILELRQHYMFYSCFDALPSSLLDPSWVQVCRNPNLAKCGGEAQHLEELGIWSPPGLPNV